jgi:hypothetical protein
VSPSLESHSRSTIGAFWLAARPATLSAAFVPGRQGDELLAGEGVDEVEVVDRGAGVGLREQQGRGVGVRGADVDEVDVLAVDLGGEVRDGVDALLGGAPVEVAPGGDGLAQVGVGSAGRPVVARGGRGQAGPGEAVEQVGELGVGDGDGEGADVGGGSAGVLHVSDGTVPLGTSTS